MVQSMIHLLSKMCCIYLKYGNVHKHVYKTIIWKMQCQHPAKRSPSSLRSYSLCCFPEGPFNIFVSQAIDERVEQWIDHRDATLSFPREQVELGLEYVKSNDPQKSMTETRCEAQVEKALRLPEAVRILRIVRRMQKQEMMMTRMFERTVKPTRPRRTCS